LIHPLRFLGVSIPLFLAWTWWLRESYLRAIAELFAFSARLFGRGVYVVDVRAGDVRFEYGDIGWSDSFGLTGINIVALVGLVLATGGVTLRRRARMLTVGLALLVATQVLGLWTDIAHVHLHARALGFANALRAFMTGFGTFFFPILIWLWLVRDRLPFATRAAPQARAVAP
jgi:hypothetical protein